MGIFGKKEKKPATEYERVVSKAKDILDKLGDTKSEITYSIAPTARYFHDRVYNGYGLHIVEPDYKRSYLGNYEGFHINFDGKRVLDNKKFIRGSWEDVLDELHKTIPVILQQKEDAARIEEEELRVLSIVEQASEGDETVIYSFLKIKSSSHYSGYYDEWWRGTSYEVYYFDKLVFSGFNDPDKKDKVYEYIPGAWEGTLELYIKERDLEKTRLREEQREQVADDGIKALRKMRGKY